MLSCFKKEPSWPKDFKPAFLVCGLDNAGKSTVVSRINGDPSDPIPTVGFVPCNVKLGSRNVVLYDVGGGSRIRDIWSSYFAEIYAVIYVIDATDVQRLSEMSENFRKLVDHRYLERKPFLIFANKQDTNGALSAEQISAKLQVKSDNFKVFECSAIHQAVDKNIKAGMVWVIRYIEDNLDELLSKVSGDKAEADAERTKEREERRERIRRAREEREKVEDKVEVSDKVDSDEDDMVCSPFKPIRQAFSDPNTPTSPETSQGDSKVKKGKKKKRKGNRVTPIHSAEGSQKSLLSDESFEVTPLKLPPLLLSKPSSNASLDKSSVPPISKLSTEDSLGSISADWYSVSTEPTDKSKSSQLISSTSEEHDIPGIFQNKYQNAKSLDVQTPVDMLTVHVIKIDRDIFIKNVMPDVL